MCVAAPCLITPQGQNLVSLDEGGWGGTSRADENVRVPIGRAQRDEQRNQLVLDASSATNLSDLAESRPLHPMRDDRIAQPSGDDRVTMTRAAKNCRSGSGGFSPAKWT